MQLLAVDISEEGIANDSGTLLTILLKDRTTNKNIVWASPSYEGMGKPFCADQPIRKNLIIGPYDSIIQPRVEKNKRNQDLRTRKRGEVFTPPWLVDKQVSIVMNEIGDIPFESFIALRWLELACGEAPYIVTRYDSITGDIIPVEKRVGFLDRKLQRIAKQSITEKEFIKWSKIAYESSYGYELQGDSLLLARENLLLSFCEYYNHKFGKLPSMKVIKQIATIISYNIFQMNGLTKQTPYSDNSKNNIQLNLFDEVNNQEMQGDKFTLVKDWENKVLVSVDSISKGDEKMKFDVVIGNPPYQEEMEGTSDKPIYNYMMDASEEIADKVCLITPARFLFNAGKTPKSWNRKKLNDPHFKVNYYEQDSSKVFPNTDIQGGVVITYSDNKRDYGNIGTFTPFLVLNTIMDKVSLVSGDESLSELIYAPESYKLSQDIHVEYPDIENRLSKGHKFDITTNIFEKLPEFFKAQLDSNENERDYIKFIGRENNARCEKWIKRKYIKSKFARTMLGILKVTQDNKKESWRKVPLQDFTPNSDIDWSQSIEDIDQQLYKKYNLSQDEIDFIESKVRAMD